MATANGGDNGKPVIFLAEDDEHISYLLGFLLERQGYIVETAADGHKFIDLLQKTEQPDLILLDIMLPYVDGYELIKQIRIEKNWQTVPIVMLSALHRDEDIVKAFNAGASDYVTKPFQPQELIARLVRLMEPKQNVASNSL